MLGANLLLAFLATWVSVGLKATQNLSVFHSRWLHIPPTSLMLAVVDYYIINLIVTSSPWVIAATALGGAAGCWCSILFNNHWKKRHVE